MNEVGHESSVTFSDLGYYNGQKIAVKMTVKNKTIDESTDESRLKRNWIGITKDNFFRVSLNPYSEKDLEVEVTYEFLSQTTSAADYDKNNPWKTVETGLSGYWTLSGLRSNKILSFDEDMFEKIYSISRDYQTDGNMPIELQYEVKDGKFNLYPTAIPGDTSIDNRQIRTALTFNDKKAFKFDFKGVKTSPVVDNWVSYEAASIAKVEIPDPQGIAQTVTNITEKQYPNTENQIEQPINNQFIQFIPYEMKNNDWGINNQNQEMTWTLPDNPDGILQVRGSWTVKNESGTDATDLFTFDGNKVTAKKEKSDLYNHYYTFQRNLEINNQVPIDPTALVEKEGGKYLTNDGNVSLKVDDLPDVTSPFSTEVNFAANLPYTYELKNKNGDDVTPSGYAPDPTENSALITQEYKPDGFTGVNEVISNQDIDYGLIGYKIDGVEYPLNSEDLDTLKIKYTTNPVTLVYQEGAGAVLSFDVTSTLNFGSHTIQAQNDIPQEGGWQLIAENASGYKVTAERTDFTADGVTNPLAAKLSLHFEDNDGESKSVEIPPATGPVDLNKIPLDGSWTIDSDNSTATSKEAGFSLNVPAGNITAGKQYKSEITFTLTDAP